MKKIKNLEILIILFYFICMLGLNNHNNDYIGYSKLIFNNPHMYIRDICFIKIVEILKMYNFSYQVIPILVAVMISLTFIRIKKIFNINIFWAIFFYSCFPLVMDIIQLRNTIVYFLFLNVILDLIQKKYFRMLTILVLSLGFHKIGFLYIGVLVLVILSRKYRITLKKSFILTVLGIVFVFIVKDKFLIYVSRLNSYFRKEFGILSIGMWGTIYLINELINKYNLILLSLMLYFEEFTRIGRNYYIYALIYYKKRKNSIILIIILFYFNIIYLSYVRHRYIICFF